LQRIATSDADDLVRLISPSTFGSLSPSTLLLSVPNERRSAETWTQLSEMMRSSEKHQLALTFINRALAMPASPAVKSRRQLLKLELLLLTNQHPQAAELVGQIENLTDEQLLGLADLFARFERNDVAARLFEQVRQRSNPQAADLALLCGRQAGYLKKSPRRWELLVEGASLLPAGSSAREQFLEQVFEEANHHNDSSTLAELAEKSKDAQIAARLRMQQADLMRDRRQAGQIVLNLLKSGLVPQDRFTWAMDVLNEADLSEEVVRIVEARLRRSQPVELGTKTTLRNAYLKLKRPIDAERAATDPFDHVVIPKPAAPAPFVGGGGFF
jgi:hypothetical protein